MDLKKAALFAKIHILCLSAGIAFCAETVPSQPVPETIKSRFGRSHFKNCAQETTYYIDPAAGNDRNPGTHPAKAWKTFANINSRTFGPGDTVLLKGGAVFDGQELKLTAEGTEECWVGLGSYGTGRAVIQNPPPDLDQPLEWTPSLELIQRFHPGWNWPYRRIAVKLNGDYLIVSGLEITGRGTQFGILLDREPSGRGYANLHLADNYIHHLDINALVPPSPMADDPRCAPECPELFWEAGGTPMGSAVSFLGSIDNVIAEDNVVIEAPGGFSGAKNGGLFQNNLLVKTRASAFSGGGSGWAILGNTITCNQFPQTVYWGSSSILDMDSTDALIARNQFAYENLCGQRGIGGRWPDSSAASFDLNGSHITLRQNFAQDIAGSFAEFDIAGQNRFLTAEENVIYHNGFHEAKSIPVKSNYLAVSLIADFCYETSNHRILNNKVIASYPGQLPFFLWNHPDPVDPNQGEAADLNLFQSHCPGYEIQGNRFIDFHKAKPEDVRMDPLPEPLGEENIASRPGVRVEASSDPQATKHLAIDGRLETVYLSKEKRPWIKVILPQPFPIVRVRLADAWQLDRWIVSGRLEFLLNGKVVQSLNVTGGLGNNGLEWEGVFPPVTANEVKFAVTRSGEEVAPAEAVFVPNNGLSEIKIYQVKGKTPQAAAALASVPETAAGRYGGFPRGRVEAREGIRFGADWTKDVDPSTGRQKFYIDFPRNFNGDPSVGARKISLPKGKVLQKLTISCPEGAKVSFNQAGNPGVAVPCSGSETEIDTGFVLADTKSHHVNFWIDLTDPSVRERNLNDVKFSDFQYGE